MSLLKDNRPRTRDGIWPSLNRFVFTLILCSLAIPVAYAFLPEVRREKETRVRVDALRADLEREKLTLTRHQREEHLLRHSTDYISLLARDRLDMMKEGETIYRLDAPKAQR